MLLRWHLIASIVLLSIVAKAQDADFLDVTDDPLFIAQVVFTFLQGRCWNFYSQGVRYPEMPNRDDYDDITFPAADVQQHLPRQTTGPASLQGLFHLQIPDMVPEVVSFADTNEGGGLGLPLAGSPPQRRVRIMSEGVSACSFFATRIPYRVWRRFCIGLSSSTMIGFVVSLFFFQNWAAPFSAENADLITGDNDLILEWILTEGTPEEPLAFDIFVDVRLPVGCLRTSTRDCGSPFQQWRAVLQNVPGVNPHPQWPDAYVWRRESSFQGQSSSYEAVQIVNGAGTQLSSWNNYLSVTQRFNPFFTKKLRSPLAPRECGAAPFWCIVPVPLLCG